MPINPFTKRRSKPASDDPVQHKIAWQLWFYFVGSMFTQISTNSAQVIGPLVLLKISSSSFMSLIFGLTAGSDAIGTLFGSFILKFCSPNVTLVILQMWRLICNLLLVLLLKFNSLNRINASILILADNFSLGMYDTVRALLPLVWTDNTDNKDNSIHRQLKELNQKAQFMFEAGTLIGPLLIGIALKATNDNQEIGVWCTVLFFGLTCLCFIFVPRKIAPVPKSKQNFKQTIFQIIHSNDSTMKQCYLTMILLQIYRVKSSLPALVANSILHSPSSTAWITSMWGVSGMIGSLAFRNIKSASVITTLKYDAVALFIFAFGWKTYNLYAYLMTVILYISIDSIARLQVQTNLQAEITINSLDASIMSSNRFLCKVNALLVRLAISACFYAPNINDLPFWLTTVFFVLCSIITIGLAYWFQKNKKRTPIIKVPASKCVLDTTPHNYPGYLFVFEGLDGSGKSTQVLLLMELLKERYPDKRIHLTTWNSSILLSNTIKQFKRQCLFKNAHSFALLQCADLMERLNTLIIPALKNGDIVLCDRYCFTALARDKVRGCDLDWEAQLYKFQFKEDNDKKPILIWPDAILLFRVPPHIAIARVYARSLITINSKRLAQTVANDNQELDSDDENDSDPDQSDQEIEEGEDHFNQEESASNFVTDDQLFKRRIDRTFRGSVSYDTIADDLPRPRASSLISTETKKQYSLRHNTVSVVEILPCDQHEHQEIETLDYHKNNDLLVDESERVSDHQRKNDNNNIVSSSVIQVSYYEAGLDLNLDPDINVNFHYFQHKVQSVYEELLTQYSFTNTCHSFDGVLDRETLFEQIKKCIETTIAQRNEQRNSINSCTKNNNIEQQIITSDGIQVFTISEQLSGNIPKNINNSILQPPSSLPGDNNDKLFRFYRKSHKTTKIGSIAGAALHFYSRFLTLQLQKRFSTIWESLTNQSIHNKNQIKSYLHGNAQLDNCIITYGENIGCFLLDFDRSRIGPISWDIIRLLLSTQIAFNTKPIILNEKKMNPVPIYHGTDENKVDGLTILPVTTAIRTKLKQFANDTKTHMYPSTWSQSFQQGYIDGIDAKAHLQTLSYTLKKLLNRTKKQSKIPNYLKSSRSEPILLNQIQDEQSASHYISQLLQQYLDSSAAQHAGLISDMNQLDILEIGRTYSTQHRERIIVIIQYENKLYDLEFKLMLHDADDNGFSHPGSTDVFDDAQRYLLAAEFYLPQGSIHQPLYGAACKGPQSSTYLAFIHQIQSSRNEQNRRTNCTLKFRVGMTLPQLDSLQIQELLYSLGHQLGYAHIQSINSNRNQKSNEKEMLTKIHLSTYIKKNWAKMIECVLQLQSEMIESFEIFVKQQKFDLKNNLQ